jgi:NADH-quinone oxidoreductase subunit N
MQDVVLGVLPGVAGQPGTWDLLMGSLPVVAAGASSLLLLLLAPFVRKPRVLATLSLGLLAACGYAVYFLWELGGKVTPATMLSSDRLALFFDGLFLLAAALVIAQSPAYLEKKGAHKGEYYGLVLISVAGMMILASATNFLTFYLGLETMSIAFYVLAGFVRTHENSVESSLKYFLLGAFSSSFLLFGMALLYGSSGSLEFGGLAAALSAEFFQFGKPMALFGFFLFLVGLFFKLSLVPFHFWAPDVYQGAPTPFSALMAVGGKSAAAAAAIRVFLSVFAASPLLSAKWFTLLAGVGIITIFVGSMIALTQRHMKRLLAYSSIVHAGFIALGLGGLAILPKTYAQSMLEAVVFYLAAYLFMNVGAFAVAAALEPPGSMDEPIRAYSGLGSSAPLLAGLFSLLFFSLAGIPLTAGFIGKFKIFGALVQSGYYALAAWGFLGAVLATYYYLRVVVTLYFPPPSEETAQAPRLAPSTWVVLAIVCSATLYLGIFPGLLSDAISGLGIG